MKVSEAVQYMTKVYLHRIIDSFTRDWPKPDEERARSIIVKNAEELTDRDRIRRTLSFEGKLYADLVFQHHILEVLLNQPDHRTDEALIVEEVRQLEEEIVAKAKQSDSLKYEDAHALEVLEEVLRVAVEDERITDQEVRLIRRLSEKLGVSETAKKVLLAKLNHFPRARNELHRASEFRDALNDLQRVGVVFYCNRLEGGQYVIPDEVVPGVRAALGIELGEKPWRLLLDSLSVHQLFAILSACGLPGYGRKEDRIERVIAAGIAPSGALGTLSNKELYDLCKSLPGANVGGGKNQRVRRIIDYFANLVVREVSHAVEPGERYYEYLTELAHRDRKNLLSNKVIKKDREMDSAFEKGARWLFENRLELTHLPMEGSDHPDGVVEFSPGGDLLMWDTKSKEGIYSFPASHLKQFKRYIRDSLRRVSCFLVVVPRVGDGVEIMAARLKVESRTDTDMAVVTAEDLKWVAETWRGYARRDRFNLEVFNITGLLTRQVLERRMKMFL